MTILVQIFSSPGCGKCTQAKKHLLKLTDEYEPNLIEISEVNVLEQLDYAVSLGIVTTPAIVINGKLSFTQLPSIKDLKTNIDSLLGQP